MIGYVVNQYPKVSHSFIRREILALEQLGECVARFAIRGWDAEVVDTADLAEQATTTYLLGEGAGPLLAATGRQMITNGRRFAAAAGQVCRMWRRTDRSAFRHLVTLAEACLLAEKAAAAGLRHMHAHFGTNSTELAMLASRLSGIPYSFTVHGPDEFDKPEFIRLRDKVHHARFVIAISDYGASQIYRWISLADWPKVHVVRCGIEAGFAAAWTQPTYPNRLVCVGRLSAQKGHLLLIQAAARLIRAGGNLELILVGDGEMRAEIEAVIRAEQVDSAVTITGWVDGATVRQHLLDSRGLVLTSFAEGLPVVIMEAMAMGRVVLAPHIAGIPELVEDERTGWLFAAGSVQAAAAAMRLCLAASDLQLAAMGERARVIVAERHDQRTEATALMRLMNGSVAPQDKQVRDAVLS
jgi:glycosyltransferase involved in cell wall biosynthesis